MADFIYAGDGGAFKTCTKCNETKSANQFPSRKKSFDGLGSWCRVCVCKKVCAKWHSTPRIKNTITCERCLMPCERNSSRQKYCGACSPIAIRNNNAEKARIKSKTDEFREYARNYKRKKLKDPHFRINNSMRRNIWLAIREMKAGRSWESLVGYTLTDLVGHMEQLFQNGMSWANYGKWEIDHIIPIAAFNYQSPDCMEFRRCWSLSNLQPLWMIDNRRKGDRTAFPTPLGMAA